MGSRRWKVMGHFEADSSEMLRFWPPEGGWVEGASLGERGFKGNIWRAWYAPPGVWGLVCDTCLRNQVSWGGRGQSGLVKGERGQSDCLSPPLMGGRGGGGEGGDG